MSRPWTRSMPAPLEENYGTQADNNFTQGQSSQQGSETALSQMCRLYEQSQQQHREMMNQVINMTNHHGQYPQHSKLSELQKTRPPTFSHTDKPLEAEDWLRDVERKLNIAQCSDPEKVLYAPHYLTGAAASWWENFLHMHSNENNITWDDFKEGFRGTHIPKSIMKIKKREFDDLKQRNMTVSDYNGQFTLLSRYANEDRMTESKKMEKFLDGLAPALKCQLVIHTFLDFKTLVDKAITLENERRSLDDIRKRKRDQTNHARNHRSRTDFQKGGTHKSSSNVSRPTKNFHARDKEFTYRPGVTCYACGEEGHYAKQCPKPRSSAPKPNNDNNNSAPKQKNFNPNNNHRKGHLNHVTKEEAQNAPDIVLGTFPVNTIPAMVLFDSGASHSFISKSFALQKKNRCFL